MFRFDARQLTSNVHLTIYFVRLFIEQAVIWGIYFALKRTLLNSPRRKLTQTKLRIGT